MTCGTRRVVPLCVAAVLVVLLAGSAVSVTGALPADVPRSNTLPGGDAQVATASVVDDPAALDDPVTSSTTGDAVLADDAAGDDGTIHLTQTLHRLPETPGQYDADNRYRIPDHVVELEVTVPERASALRTEGFVAEGDGRYTWDGTTDDPRIQFRMPANETIDRDDPLAGPGEFLFVDTTAWGLVQRPPLGHSWSWRGSPAVRFDRTLHASPGAAGTEIAYLGEYEERTHAAHDQQFRLIVPAQADMAEDPETVFETLSTASDTLRVGDRDDAVFLVAAPTTSVRWGVRGVQTGDADAWVRDLETVDDVENVWVHEYVHTRQDYQTTGQTRWFTEAAATYYAALHALEHDRVGFDTFRDRLRIGTNGRFEGVVLADAATWLSNPDYYVGPLVLGDLDRRTRTASASERALHTVFARMNDADERVGADQFYGYVADAASTDEADRTRRYAETTERPVLWNISTHQSVFGPIPARFDYRLATVGGVDAVRATGTYRNRGLRTPYVLVPGERLSVDVIAENVGGTAGDYDVHLRTDAATLDRRGGRLAAGSSATVTVNGTFDTPGEYSLRVAGETVPVSVWEPARADVTGLDIDRAQVRPGEPVTVSVTVENDDGWPGERDVRVTAGEQSAGDGTGDHPTVAERTVRLDAESERAVTATVSFDEPGTYQIGVADSDVPARAVTVESDSDPVFSPGTSTVVAVIAFVVAAILGAALARRR